MAKFKRIRALDFDNRVAVVEPGVTNLAISQAVEHAGFYYAPDPSSQIACTIGGNVAENSGGVHCLKYGVTTNNVLGCELVLMTGEILPARRPASRFRRLRSPRRRHRFGGPARRRHRGDSAHSEEAGMRARRARRLCRGRGRLANASPASSAPASFPVAWR
jgi:FAD/FMN-containing dehydrogenase